MQVNNRNRRVVLWLAFVFGAFVLAGVEIALNKRLETSHAAVPKAGVTPRPQPNPATFDETTPEAIDWMRGTWTDPPRHAATAPPPAPEKMVITFDHVDGRNEQLAVEGREKEKLWQFIQSHLRQEVTIPVPAVPMVSIDYRDHDGTAHEIRYNAGDYGFSIDGGPGRLSVEQRKNLTSIVKHYFGVDY